MPDEKPLDVSKDLSIDVNSLDEELIKQPTLYKKYADVYADAIFAKDKAKQRFEVVKAEIDAEVRKNPSQFGIEKINETVVGYAVIRDPRYQAAYTEMVETTRTVNLISGIMTSFESKKKSLEKLVGLYQTTYWSEPQVSGVREATQRIIEDGQIKDLNNNPRLLALHHKQNSH